ncbi:MAG TPA: wax ester/triacylglycerol synthase family O-acyltransferase [Jatrophihabitans sp.]|jgi:diacylglycerol O-acyltransferase|uniref:WS/DGAT/MGAT family O-acyltransferase n=1 Tax=Jatrophihabitans sp. TaxID=1932789 RepID=UPI002DF8CC4E|nr:wax ester/triacylglycerol synthase family O-acyltransferase [Jatrophihabitans sp.]
MLLPMPPTSSLFLMAESREHPMHVGSLQLFQPPEGATALDVRRMFDDAIGVDEVAPLFQKRPRRSISTLGQWAWETDRAFDLEHHVRRNALPAPGRILELLALCSRLHSTLLDRHRPLWEMHLIEGLEDGRYAAYFKVHHSLVDGVSALRMLSRQLSTDADERNMPAPWAPRERAPREPRPRPNRASTAASTISDALGLGPALLRTVTRAINDQSGSMSLAAPKSMLNVDITGARRFAAQSWPIERIRGVGKAADATVNDVVLAMCSGALRQYMQSLDALPESSLIAMVPVSLHGDGPGSGDGGGNAVGAVMCRLGTDLDDAGERLATVHQSMAEGKEALSTMSPSQILAMSALGISPLALWPALRLTETMRPPFNLIISNVPGPREPMYWNGARLDGLYPLSIPLDGQALNITCTSYSSEIAFGLTGCRRTVPHLQRLLGYLDDELAALERAVGL